jgi:hypothetical protein
MQTISRQLLQALIGTAVCTLTMSISMAQDLAPKSVDQLGDPPRWYQEEMTPQAYLLTLKKEAGAAYGESVIACKQSDVANRATCMREAHRRLEQDMADARTKSQANR